jgi:hypothetical protein
MHPDARNRMRQLVLAAIDGIDIDTDETLDVSSTFHTLQPLSKFVDENFNTWIDALTARMSVHFCVQDAVHSVGLLDQAGPLRNVISDEQREAVAREVCEFWDAVPITYEFLFPLPNLKPFEQEVPVAPGVTLKNAPRDQVDADSMGLPVPLGGLMGAAPMPLVPSLAVAGEGLMLFGLQEAAFRTAIRRAKVALQLSLVEGVFGLEVTKLGPPKVAAYLPRRSIETVSLPTGFASVLARLKFTPATDAQPPPLAERLVHVSAVLTREREWNPARKRAPRGSTEELQWHLYQHCARIANAAEWLFDADHEQASPTTFVQTAIAFEALYGGAKGEPIVETLANRVAYSLGSSPQTREQHVQALRSFYGTRSSVVHSGATRLGREEERQLYLAQITLKRAFHHELRLVSKGIQEIAAAQEMDRRQR